MMRIVFAALLLLCLGAQGLRAQELDENPSPEKMTAAVETVKAYRAAAGFEAVLESISLSTKNVFIRNNPDLEKDINEVTDLVMQEFAASRGLLEESIAFLWARRFSEEELNQITEFYKSDIGAKLAIETPFLISETFRTVDVFRAEISDAVVQRVRNVMRDRGHNL